MPLKPLSTSILWSKDFTKPTRDVNAAIAVYNKSPTGINLQLVEETLNRPPRIHWAKQFKEVNSLEFAIAQEKEKFSGSSGTPGVLGATAPKNLAPSRWIERLFLDAPSLDGFVLLGDSKKGAQGATFKFELGNRILLAKTARGKDTNIQTECRREFEFYKLLYRRGEHPNLAKVWGWADLKLGDQHAEGFLMDFIKGADGFAAQKLLKDHWDLGIISTAQYWGAIQYIGRCHITVVRYLNDAGWVHNDIKPENYMVSATTGEVIVIDLGGAADIGRQPAAVTSNYLAPEMRLGGRPNPEAVGSVGSDVFSIGATLAHATEAPHAIHEQARPNQGVQVKAVPYLSNTPVGLVRNQFEYGVETDFTRQLNRMMSENPLERQKVVDEVASNRFLNDSMLNDNEAKEVLSGVVSGRLDMEWRLKWAAAGKTPPTILITDRSRIERDLDLKTRALKSKVTQDAASITEGMLGMMRAELSRIAQLIQHANAFGIDTRRHQNIVNQKSREYDLLESEIKKPKSTAVKSSSSSSASPKGKKI
jgi:serine/threonine protein kinase